MTEPSSARPVPGPPRPGPAAGRAAAAEGSSPASDDADARRHRRDVLRDLAQRPVAEHVGVFEAEHARLQRELGTIDQL